MNFLPKLSIFALVMVVLLIALSPIPTSASEQESPSFDQILEERDWTPLEMPSDEVPSGDKMGNFAWTNIFVGVDHSAPNYTHYVSSTVCGGGVYVYWWGIPASSIGTLGVSNAYIADQIHINTWGGLNGHYDCFAGNRCDVRLCAKSGTGFSPSATKLKY